MFIEEEMENIRKPKPKIMCFGALDERTLRNYFRTLLLWPCLCMEIYMDLYHICAHVYVWIYISIYTITYICIVYNLVQHSLCSLLNLKVSESTSQEKRFMWSILEPLPLELVLTIRALCYGPVLWYSSHPEPIFLWMPNFKTLDFLYYMFEDNILSLFLVADHF